MTKPVLCMLSIVCLNKYLYLSVLTYSYLISCWTQHIWFFFNVALRSNFIVSSISFYYCWKQHCLLLEPTTNEWCSVTSITRGGRKISGLLARSRKPFNIFQNFFLFFFKIFSTYVHALLLSSLELLYSRCEPWRRPMF